MIIWLLLPAAWAHADGQLLGIDLHALESGSVGIETSFGLVWSPDGARQQWICHEAVTDPEARITPRYAASEDGVVLGLVPALEQTRDEGVALYRSTDQCEWAPVTGLDHQELADVVFDPADPQHALVVTADPAEGVSNGIRRSTDGGASFDSVLDLPERVFRTVHISPAGGAWASAIWAATSEGWVYTSPDGETWTEHAIAMPPADGTLRFVDVIAVSPIDPQTAWVVVGPYGEDTLLRTTDGGESFEEIVTLDGDILDGAVDPDGGVWLAVSGREFYYAADGEEFSLVEDASRGMGVQGGLGAVWLVNDATVTGHIAQRVTGGMASIESVFHLSELVPQDCPARSEMATYCDALWVDLESRLPLPPDGDTGEVAEDSGAPGGEEAGRVKTRCGCQSKGAVALLFPVVLLGIRRRRGC